MDPAALGRYLRESREAREMTLDEVTQVLRIRRGTLENFEQGNFDVDASPVQIWGLLRNYARHIGLDEDRVLEYYQAALDTDARKRRRSRRREPPPAMTDTSELVAPRRITDTPPSLPAVDTDERRARKKRRRSGGMGRTILILMATALAMTVIVLVALQILVPASETGEAIVATHTPTTNPDLLTPTNTPIPTSTSEPTEEVMEDFSMPGGGVQVIIEVVQRSFIRAVVDDVEQFSGIAEPGTVQTFDGLNSINITAANAAALQVIFNGQTQSSFGARGEQVDLTFTSTGFTVATPQGIETAPPTNTQFPTPTPLFPEQADEQASNPADPIGEAEATAPVDAASQAQPASTQVLAVPQLTPTFTVVVDATIATTPTDAGGVATTVAPPTSVPLTSTPTQTETVVPTATNTIIPTNTLTPTITLTPSATAILPIRATPANPTPTKSG